MDARTNTDDRRAHRAGRDDRRATGPIPRLVPRDVAIDAAAQAYDVAAALTAERIRVAAEVAIARGQ